MRRDSLTHDLFDWEPPQVAADYGPDVAGRGNLDSQISRLIGRALSDARNEGRGSRAELARRMSADLGRTISEEMLNKWSSESSAGHRIPLDTFIALIRATEATELLGFLPGLFGFVAVPKRYADIIELHLIDEHERDIAARKATIAARVRAKR